ncbi:MAG: hypothetical protein ABSG86_09435 [Thermoguttaceae bacterium]
MVQASRLPRPPGRPHHKSVGSLLFAALGLTAILALGPATARAAVYSGTVPPLFLHEMGRPVELLLRRGERNG